MYGCFGGNKINTLVHNNGYTHMCIHVTRERTTTTPLIIERIQTNTNIIHENK